MLEIPILNQNMKPFIQGQTVIILYVISREKIMDVFYIIYILSANCCCGPEHFQWSRNCQSPESPSQTGKEAGHGADISDSKMARVP